MKYNCEIIKDLLPLYVDNICSSQTREIVEEHLNECADCRAYLKELKETIIIENSDDKAEEMTNVLKNFYGDKNHITKFTILTILNFKIP